MELAYNLLSFFLVLLTWVLKILHTYFTSKAIFFNLKWALMLQYCILAQPKKVKSYHSQFFCLTAPGKDVKIRPLKSPSFTPPLAKPYDIISSKKTRLLTLCWVKLLI